MGPAQGRRAILTPQPATDCNDAQPREGVTPPGLRSSDTTLVAGLCGQTLWLRVQLQHSSAAFHRAHSCTVRAAMRRPREHPNCHATESRRACVVPCAGSVTAP
eukprot:97470-Chlamydomonas_euryale.AAC.3